MHRLADRLVALQQEDGSWPQYKEGPGNLSTTIEAYFASNPTSKPHVKSFPPGADGDPGAAAMSIFRTHGGGARVVWAYLTNYYDFGDPVKLRWIKAGVLSYASGNGFTIT